MASEKKRKRTAAFLQHQVDVEVAKRVDEILDGIAKKKRVELEAEKKDVTSKSEE